MTRFRTKILYIDFVTKFDIFSLKCLSSQKPLFEHLTTILNNVWSKNWYIYT